MGSGIWNANTTKRGRYKKVGRPSRYRLCICEKPETFLESQF